MSDIIEDPDSEVTEILYQPPHETKHFPLDKVLDDIYHKLEVIENQLNSIFNLNV
jgi:hypothetical protein